MFLEVTQARYLDGYKIWLEFNDGSKGSVDLENVLTGKVFTPLKNIESFKKVCFREDYGTIFWENGADFAPEFLKEKLQN